MTEPSAGLKRGYYLLNTDGGMASNGRRRSGDPWAARRLVRSCEPPSGPRGSDLEGDRPCHPQRGGVPSVDHELRIHVDPDSLDPVIARKLQSLVSAVRQAHLSELHEVADSLVALFESICISWVPREMNASSIFFGQLVRRAGRDEPRLVRVDHGLDAVA
jgi:hypothetical protein